MITWASKTRKNHGKYGSGDYIDMNDYQKGEGKKNAKRRRRNVSKKTNK